MKKYRQERIEKEIIRVMGKLLFEDIKNPKIQGIITATKVALAPDLRNCTIHVSVLKEGDRDEVVDGLNEMRGFIRRRLGEELMLRYVPVLHFKLDDSIEYGIRMSKILNEL